MKTILRSFASSNKCFHREPNYRYVHRKRIVGGPRTSFLTLFETAANAFMADYPNIEVILDGTGDSATWRQNAVVEFAGSDPPLWIMTQLMVRVCGVDNTKALATTACDQWANEEYGFPQTVDVEADFDELEKQFGKGH